MEELTLQELLHIAKRVRNEKQLLEKEVKALYAELEEAKERIRMKLHAEGIQRTSVDGITVSLTDATVYNIDNYSLFHDFILASGHTGLLQRRVANNYVKELLKASIEVPGLVPFVKENVNLRIA
jgi:hypothetical protein